MKYFLYVVCKANYLFLITPSAITMGMLESTGGFMFFCVFQRDFAWADFLYIIVSALFFRALKPFFKLTTVVSNYQNNDTSGNPSDRPSVWASDDHEYKLRACDETFYINCWA